MAGKDREGFSSRSQMTVLLRKPVGIRDRVVVALNDTVFAAWIARRLRRLGWGVHLARSAAEVRRLTAEFSLFQVFLTASSNYEHTFNLHGDVAGQGAHADGTSRSNSRVFAKDLGHQFGKPIDDFWVVLEVRRAIHHSQGLD